ncbi:MAG: hypothetical protein ACREDR_12050 [Blastocatellia bacterium]
MTVSTKLTLSVSLAALLIGGVWSSKPAFATTDKDGAAAPAATINLPVLPQILPATTVPGNGDLNPYGVAFVPPTFPQANTVLRSGDILVANFNNSNNMQATGTSIVRIAQDGTTSLFFQGTAPLGLTTALAILKKGFIIVGNVPTTDGTCGTLGQGSLLVLDAGGNLVATITDPTLLDSPWDMAVDDEGHTATAYVSNVVSGTVTRIDLAVNKTGVKVLSRTSIAAGFNHSCSAATFVIGPTGLAFDSNANVLYVASTGDNAIFAIDNASTTAGGGMGRQIYSDNVHLHGPLGMTMAPNGHLLVSNGDAVNPDPNQPSEIVEFTTSGQFVSQLSVDPNFGGAFGLAVKGVGNGFFRFAAVDDNTSSLRMWTLQSQQ